MKSRLLSVSVVACFVQAQQTSVQLLKSPGVQTNTHTVCATLHTLHTVHQKHHAMVLRCHHVMKIGATPQMPVHKCMHVMHVQTKTKSETKKRLRTSFRTSLERQRKRNHFGQPRQSRPGPQPWRPRSHSAWHVSAPLGP